MQLFVYAYLCTCERRRLPSRDGKRDRQESNGKNEERREEEGEGKRRENLTAFPKVRIDVEPMKSVTCKYKQKLTGINDKVRKFDVDGIE